MKDDYDFSQSVKNPYIKLLKKPITTQIEKDVVELDSRHESFTGMTVRLEPDVAEMFPNAEAVNEALRLLIRVMKENQISVSEARLNESIGAD